MGDRLGSFWRECADVLCRASELVWATIRCFWFVAFAASETRDERLTFELDRLGGLFKKIGQHLSSRPDLVGASLARKLESLRDGRGETMSRGVSSERRMRRRVADQLEVLTKTWWDATGREEGDAESSSVERSPFAEFDETPIARGCVAQVYRAKLAGTPPVEVAVKVLVPGAKRAFRSDAALLRWAAAVCRLAERCVPKTLVRVPWAEAAGIATRFSEALVAQTDLLEEGLNLCRMLEKFGTNDPDCRVPVPIVALSTQKMLVMEWIEGKPLDGAVETADETNRRSIVEKYLRVVEKMVLRDGLLHGDLHPGNVLLGEDGRLVLLDVGIAIDLSERMRSSCWKSVKCFLRRDWKGCAELMYRESPSTPFDPPNVGAEKTARLAREIETVQRD